MAQLLTCGLIEMLLGRLKKGTKGKEGSKGPRDRKTEKEKNSAEYASIQGVLDCICEFSQSATISYCGSVG